MGQVEPEFTQPELGDDSIREIKLTKNISPELPNVYVAYSLMQFKPSDRWGAVKLYIDKGKIVKAMQFGHLEIEREYADDSFKKLLSYEERIR